MVRKLGKLLGLLLVGAALVGFTPLQAGGAFEWRWWYGVLIVSCLLLPLLILIAQFAAGEAPPEDALRAQQAARTDQAATTHDEAAPGAPDSEPAGTP